MEPKDFLPIVGVLVGWFLSSLGAAWKARDANRQNIGRLLTKLVELHHNVAVLMSVSESIKDRVGDWAEYEKVRAGVYARHFLSRDNVSVDIRSAIDAIAGTYPTLCIDLHVLLELMEKSKKLSLRESAQSKELYIALLSAHEAGLELLNRRLRRAIFGVAARHSPITLIRVSMRLRRSSQEAQLPSVVDKAISDAYDNVHSKQMPAAGSSGAVTLEDSQSPPMDGGIPESEDQSCQSS